MPATSSDLFALSAIAAEAGKTRSLRADIVLDGKKSRRDRHGIVLAYDQGITQRTLEVSVDDLDLVQEMLAKLDARYQARLQEANNKVLHAEAQDGGKDANNR